MAKVDKECHNCSHWSKHVCVDSAGNPIARTAKLAPEPFWTYEECKKNWGLPKSAYLDASKCPFYKAK